MLYAVLVLPLPTPTSALMLLATVRPRARPSGEGPTISSYPSSRSFEIDLTVPREDKIRWACP